MSALSERVVERTMARAIPLSVHVDLTMRCNEQCVHCYRVIEDRRELTTAEVKTLLADLLAKGQSDEQIVGALYERVLARKPTADEERTCQVYIRKVGDRKEGLEDVLWVLVNSTEFLIKK